MIDNKNTVIVAHACQQHSYRVAEALNKEQILFKYITTVYNKEGSLTSKLIPFLRGDNQKRAKSRVCINLKNEDIMQIYEWKGLFLLLLSRIDKTKILYKYWNIHVNNSFGKKVAKYAIKNNVNAVIMYDTGAKACFQILSKKAPHIKRIMDVSAANMEYMKNIYDNDMIKCGRFGIRLKKERGFEISRKYINYIEAENKLTQYFIVASKFVQKSLKFSDVDEQKIYICPYGVDNNKFNISNKNKSYGRAIKCIYVGKVNQMKGIYYLLEAIKYFSKDKVELTLVGSFDNSDGIFNEYIERCKFVGNVTHDKVSQYLNEADIMVFPSLGDGFSLACIEGMASGLPLICTENTGISDLIENGKNGFVIPIEDINSIIDRIQWFIDNIDVLKNMSYCAIKTIEQYTWDKYEKRIVEIIYDILSL